MATLRNRRPSRHARGIARRMTRPGLIPHRQAAADTQLQDLGRALKMPRSAIPSVPGGVGRRMRLGPEGRTLARRVLSSKTIREAQAWLRELAHQIRHRARIHERRRKIQARIARRSQKIGRFTRRHATAAGRGIRDQVRSRSRGPAGRPAAPAVAAAPRMRAPRPVPAAIRTRRRAARMRRTPRAGRPAA